MDLNGENIKKIRGLILFTAVLVVCLWKYDVVFSVLKFILGVTFPFILGGAFAFVLNVPMNFLQRHLFPRKITQKSRALQKLAGQRASSLCFCSWRALWDLSCSSSSRSWEARL